MAEACQRRLMRLVNAVWSASYRERVLCGIIDIVPYCGYGSSARPGPDAAYG